jgi:hypothetical protein
MRDPNGAIGGAALSTADYDGMGSRSTSEKSSNLSSRRFATQTQQYMPGFQ